MGVLSGVYGPYEDTVVYTVVFGGRIETGDKGHKMRETFTMPKP